MRDRRLTTLAEPLRPAQEGLPGRSPIDARLGLLGFAVVLLWAVVVARFFYVSVLAHAHYLSAVEKQSVRLDEIVPKRGAIVTGDDLPLAATVTKYALLPIPRNIKDKEAFAAALAPVIGLSEQEILAAIDNNRPYVPPLVRGVEQETVQRVEALKLPGLTIRPEPYRFYPEGQLAAHLLGFVNAEGKGQYGLEGYYDEVLRGFAGLTMVEKDRKGRPIGFEEYLSPSRNGTSLVTTIDRNLQYVVEERLSQAVQRFRADGGSVVVLHAQTGEVLAMASYPSFDPNRFSEVGEKTEVFLNPATQAVWEPGSVIKPVAMAAALNEGIVQPETTETFGSSVVVDGWTIQTAQNKAFGRETMTQVLENSDNVAMVWLADKLGNERYYRYLKLFGFDDKTGIDLQGEADPTLLPADRWRNINRATMSFGQGMAVTPIQLVAAYAALGNGGKLLWPHVVKAFRTPEGQVKTVEPTVVREVITPETSRKITEMLVSVVERGHGKRARVLGYRVAGKTGTAQVPDPQGGYKTDAHVGSFCGFAPADNPLFAMCVKLDTPKNVDWAEASAAPVFGEIARWILANYNVRPSQ